MRFDDSSDTCNVCHHSYNNTHIANPDPIELRWIKMCHAVIGCKAARKRIKAWHLATNVLTCMMNNCSEDNTATITDKRQFMRNMHISLMRNGDAKNSHNTSVK